MAMSSLPHHFSQRAMGGYGGYDGASSTPSPFVMEQQRACPPPLHHLLSPPHHQPGDGGFSGGRRRTEQGRAKGAELFERERATPGVRDGGEETDHEGGEASWFRKTSGQDTGAAGEGSSDVSPIQYSFQNSAETTVRARPLPLSGDLSLPL